MNRSSKHAFWTTLRRGILAAGLFASLAATAPAQRIDFVEDGIAAEDFAADGFDAGFGDSFSDDPLGGHSDTYDDGLGYGGFDGGYGYDGGFGPSRETEQMLAPARLEGMLLDNVRKRILNEREILKNKEQAMKNRRTAVKLREFQRHVYQLARDTWFLRQKRDELTAHRRQLLKFVNGRITPTTRVHFQRALATLSQSPEMTRLLQYEAPPMEAEQFRPDPECVLGRTLAADGSLAEQPLLLVGTNDHAPVSLARRRFERLWGQVTQQVGWDEERPDREIVAELQAALGNWRTAAAATLGNADRLDRCQALSHLACLGGLVGKLKTPQGCREIRDWARGHAFPGGTVAELLNHMLDRNLSVRYGSPAQLTLKELGVDWLRELDDNITFLDGRIEQYKAQNPGLDMALPTAESDAAGDDPNAEAANFGAGESTDGGVYDGAVAARPATARLSRPVQAGSSADRLYFLKSPRSEGIYPAASKGQISTARQPSHGSDAAY